MKRNKRMVSMMFEIHIIFLLPLMTLVHGYNKTCNEPSFDQVKRLVEYYPNVELTKFVFDIKLNDECEIARCRLFLNSYTNADNYVNLIAIVEAEINWRANGNLNVVAWIETDITKRCTAIELCATQLSCNNFAGANVVITNTPTHLSIKNKPLCLPPGCITDFSCSPLTLNVETGEQFELKMQLNATYQPVILWKYCKEIFSFNQFHTYCHLVDEDSIMFPEVEKSVGTANTANYGIRLVASDEHAGTYYSLVGNEITYYTLCEMNVYVQKRDVANYSNVRIVNLYDAEIVSERVIRTLQKDDMYMFGIFIDTDQEINYSTNFFNCEFEEFASNRSLDYAFGGLWQVKNSWNMTTYMIIVTTYSANCSLAVTVHNFKRFEFIVTDVPKSVQAFGMNSKSANEYDGDLVEGESVKIQCITQKYDFHNFSWSIVFDRSTDADASLAYIENRGIVIDKNESYWSKIVTLSFKDARIEDSGAYECHATFRFNDFEISMTRTTILQVQRKQPTQIEKFGVTPANQKVAVGSTATLTCVATGSPLPKITWLKNGKELNFSAENINQIQSKQSPPVAATSTPGRIEAAIEITNVSIASAGIYTCAAGNKLKNLPEERSAKITVLDEENSLIPIIIVISASLLLIALTLLLAAAWYRIRMRPFHELHRRLQQGSPSAQTANPLIPLNDQIDFIHYDSKKYEKSPENLNITEEVLGSGASGSLVHLGYLSSASGIITVAVKKPIFERKSKIQEIAHAFFLSARELSTLCRVGDHPNLVGLVGAVTENVQHARELCICLEYCSNKSLDIYLRKNYYRFIDETLAEVESTSKSPYADWKSEVAKRYYRLEKIPAWAHSVNSFIHEGCITTGMLLKMAIEVANGMAYLGTKNVLHRDLAARNVLLTENLTAKISDFGVAFDGEKIKQRMEQGTQVGLIDRQPFHPCWVAPEVFENQYHMNKTDVWSFGIFMWEIFGLCRLDPYMNLFADQKRVDHKLLLEYLRQGKRLERPGNATNTVYEIMLSCWNLEREERPKFEELQPMLENELRRCAPNLLNTIRTGVSQESIKFTTRNSNCRLAENGENYPMLNGSASASLSIHSAPRKGKLVQPDSVLETVF